MRNSPTAPRYEIGGRPLTEAHPERPFSVLDVSEEHRAVLAREGVVPGAHLQVETIVPLGGPLIVRAGGARLAIARSIARTVVVEPAP